MSEVGRPTDLTEELTLKIRQLILDGTTYIKTREILDIPEGTWDTWIYKNYMGFRDMLVGAKKERIVKKAEHKVEELIDSEDEKVALNASTFALETLGKADYSKRSELTGADGKAVTVIALPSELTDKNAINTGPSTNS